MKISGRGGRPSTGSRGPERGPWRPSPGRAHGRVRPGTVTAPFMWGSVPRSRTTAHHLLETHVRADVLSTDRRSRPCPPTPSTRNSPP
ncbi:hypothetical protein EAO75_16165 [Streptomyces sp. uw30]|nr:hypothetical protein EAO75_16165 [Streptomyces sp. uw30]